MTIKGIIFDFGQVLTAPADLQTVTGHRKNMAETLGLEPAELWPYLFEGEVAMRLMTDEIDWETFWIEVLAPRGITDPDEVRAFSEEIFKGSDIVNPEMNELIAALHGRYKLAILSNANWTEEELAAEISERDSNPALFDTIITSATAGFAKPNPAIFYLALARLNLTAEECIFTDDLEDFTEAAATLGFHTFTFTNPADFRQYLQEEGVLI
ncbi:MAG: HAD family phosphatase [Candidatus Promineifilaceae bacterium]